MDDQVVYYDDDDDYNADYEGDYDMYEDDNFYMDREYEATSVSEIHLIELYDTCIVPVLSDALRPVIKLILCNLVFKIFVPLVSSSHVFLNLSSMMAGMWAVWMFAGWNFFQVLVLCCFSYFMLIAVRRTYGKYYAFFCSSSVVMLIVYCELFLLDKKQWHTVRGIQMIVSMKVISVAFELDSGQLSRLPTISEFGGYCFSPASVIFGPWCNFREYRKSISTNIPLTISRILRIISSFLLAITFLLISTCFSRWLFPNTSNNWKYAYKTALSFRTSHYFVSFISETTMLIAGRINANHWQFFISNPIKVELPRSLTEVVISWNMPMHHWLKTYIFRIFKPISNFAAILGTYAASSLLHGLNFQLASVLLSLGFFTYVEYIFRHKLGKIFSACICARSCRDNCDHLYKKRHPLVIITNLSFMCLSILQLAYLGVMFDDNPELQYQGYSMEHTLSKWSELNYSGHWVVLVIYIVHLLI